MTREEEIKQKAREFALDWNVGRGNEFYYRFDKLVDIARWADRTQPNPWLSAEERLPEEGKLVFARTVVGSYSVGQYIYPQWYITGIPSDHGLVSVTHWMPIPEV